MPLRRLSPWSRSWIFALMIAGLACGHDVMIGRYPGDASSDSDMQDTGGGGASGEGGEGGSGGHDECAEDEPVCGTDNMTYMNSCLALRAGVFISRRGPCP